MIFNFEEKITYLLLVKFH